MREPCETVHPERSRVVGFGGGGADHADAEVVDGADGQRCRSRQVGGRVRGPSDERVGAEERAGGLDRKVALPQMDAVDPRPAVAGGEDDIEAVVDHERASSGDDVGQVEGAREQFAARGDLVARSCTT